MNDKLNLYFYKQDERAILPKIAYNNSSACFDLYAIEDITIAPKSYQFGNHGWKILWDNPEYYLVLQNRSGNGINKHLFIHQGIIDYGYTGDLKVMINNFSDEYEKIEAGKGICQVQVLKKPVYDIKEISKEEAEKLIGKLNDIRGEKGFGSSDNIKK